MKILIVNKFLYPNGGSETYIFKLGEELKKRGHEVEYFGMEHEGMIVGNRAGIYTSNMDFHTGRLQKLFYPFKIIYSKEAYKKMLKLMDTLRPDVVHLNNFNFQLTPSIIYAIRDWEMANRQRVKIVYTAHDYQWVCPNHMMQQRPGSAPCFACKGGKFMACAKNGCIHGSKVKSLLGAIESIYHLKRKTYDMVDLIICPSEFLKRMIETYPLWKDRDHPQIVVMHNFTEKAKSNAAEKTDDESEDHTLYDKDDYVLYFGRYSYEKGVKTLLEVCKSHPEIAFRFAGSGELKDEVQKCQNVTDLGFLQGDELIKTISRAKLTIFPSEWYENCPFAVMESQMYGTPVLASDIGGVPELLQDGIRGELFRPGDADDLGRHLEGILSDSEKLQRYTENCGNVSFDTVGKYTDKFLALIDSV